MPFRPHKFLTDAISRHRSRRAEIAELRRLAAIKDCSFFLKGPTAVVRRGDHEVRLSATNLAYAQDVIRNFDYYYDVVEPQVESGRRAVDYSRPAIHTLRDGQIPFWFPQLGESMATTKIYLDRANLQPGEVVLDLGAYAGGAAYHFSPAVGPNGRVFAFEPDPGSFECLVRNVALHRLDNVIPDHRGVWSRSGRMLFQAEGNMGSAVVDASDRDSSDRRWIDVVSLDDFAREAGLERVDFVKMDIEGSEAAVLAFAGPFLRRFRPRLVIEVHRVQGLRTDAAVTAALEAAGYRVEVLDQAGLPLPLLAATPQRELGT